MRRLRGLVRSDEGGQSLVEFALVMPLLLLIITGLFDVARATWQENTLAYAAREGTRYAIVHGSASLDGIIVSTTNDQPIVDVVRNAAVGVTTVTVTVTFPDNCNSRSCRVAVDATAPFVPIPSQYLLGNAFQITLRGGSMLVMQQ